MRRAKATSSTFLSSAGICSVWHACCLKFELSLRCLIICGRRPVLARDIRPLTDATEARWTKIEGGPDLPPRIRGDSLLEWLEVPVILTMATSEPPMFSMIRSGPKVSRYPEWSHEDSPIRGSRCIECFRAGRRTQRWLFIDSLRLGLLWGHRLDGTLRASES